MKKYCDILIIGGGASGLCCAIAAKRNNPGKIVAVLERNDRVGKKLLATGNGRCNLSNLNVSKERYAGSFKNRSEQVFSSIGVRELLDFFGSLGLKTTADSEGRLYPLSNQAASVVDALRFGCEREGVETICKADIKSVKKSGKLFKISAGDNEYTSGKLVIACGSKASPKLGGTAGSADYLRNFGHSVKKFSPALCPVKVDSPVIKSLKGVRIKCGASLIKKDRLIKKELGEVQFSDKALSGICVFNLSLYSSRDCFIKLDLMPELGKSEIIEALRYNRRLYAEKPLDCFGTGLFQKRINMALVKLSGISDFSRSCKSLSDVELKLIADNIKEMTFKASENAGFDQAQTALGGVEGCEIDPASMRSLICDDLYVCGEAIDICGECGGFNLHFAFASGIIAGESL